MFGSTEVTNIEKNNNNNKKTNKKNTFCFYKLLSSCVAVRLKIGNVI